MANLTLRNLPESTLAGLRNRAAANHRSINGELLAIIDFVVAHPEKLSIDDYLWTDPIDEIDYNFISFTNSSKAERCRYDIA